MILPMLLLLAAPGCDSCHKEQTGLRTSSSMARALQRAEDSMFLKDNPDLRFTDGKYTYQVRREEGRIGYSVSDPASAITVRIAWAFGSGTMGQTYLFERNGAWYESAVSFYPAIRRLDWTPSHAARPRANLEGALGRKLDADEARRCFGCHSSDASWDDDNSRLVSINPGVECNQCHGDTPGTPPRWAAATPPMRLCRGCAPCPPRSYRSSAATAT